MLKVCLSGILSIVYPVLIVYYREHFRTFIKLFLFDYVIIDYDPNSGIVLSTPEECRRTCVDGEPPKYCYYHFHIEFYTVYGPYV